ncbi:MAG TPA: COX15/CtaA family protein [Planctomycetota bacterium]|jgi:cytochrome c oxidase assembly protein subunit 15|nr:COX15/CtaA family protein [Planctomycetota bacterium]
MGRAGLHRLSLATAGATWLLLVAGALVTSTGSGDAVPDWWFLPISYGSFLPPMVGGVLFEHGHRLVAASVGALAILLAIGLARHETRRSVRLLGFLALAAVVIQGVLGGLRVFRFQPTLVAVVHASLAQAIFAATVALSVLTSEGWPRIEPSPNRRGSTLASLASAATAALFATLVLGAVLRHTGRGIAGHVLLAGAAAVLVALTAAEALRGEEPLIRRPAAALAVLLGLQLALGVASLLVVTTAFQRSTAAPPLHLATVTAHLAVGAGLLATSLVLALRSRKGLGARVAVAIAGEAA